MKSTTASSGSISMTTASPVLVQLSRVRHHHDERLAHAAYVPIGQDPRGPIRVVYVDNEVVVHERGQLAGDVTEGTPE